MATTDDPLLRGLGERVRALRTRLGWSLRELAERAKISQRFAADLERGRGNISVRRLADVALALGTTAADLLEGLESGSAYAHASRPALGGAVITLLGLRGAGKTSVGRAAATRLGRPFVELDERIGERAGLGPGEIFELYGRDHYRALERAELAAILETMPLAIVATAGSIVTDHTNLDLLRQKTTTVWLRARPEDHYQRVLDQGDHRPMEAVPDAMRTLRTLLSARRALYERAAHVIDTSALGLERSIRALVRIASEAQPPPAA